MRNLIVLLLCLSFHAFSTKGDLPCAPRYEQFGVVCVCNSTYCDGISKIKKLRPGLYVSYTTSQEGLRFKKSTGTINKSNPIPNGNTQWYSMFVDFIDQNIRHQTEDTILRFDRHIKFQRIIGFGGEISDAAAVNYHGLSSKTKINLLNSIFSENGIEYNMARVPIAGTDYSGRVYAYNDIPEHDRDLTHFNISSEDYLYKIPFIKSAQKKATSKLFLFGSAWSPPGWMKSNKQIKGSGQLLPQYYQTWANYHIKFLEAYSKQGVSFWAITTGYQPLNGLLIIEPSFGILPFESLNALLPFAGFNSLGWIPQEQAKWLADNLGPSLRKSKFSRVKILSLDDNGYSMPVWIELMAQNRRCIDYIDGISINRYTDFITNPLFSDLTHDAYPDKFVIATGMCVGIRNLFGEFVRLGSWGRAEEYIKAIIEDLNHWHIGWVDGNLILNDKGGPSWSSNFADAAIIAYPALDEFVKQPYFYVIGHFSKFIPRGSVRIFVEQLSGNPIENVAFLRPDGGVVVVFYNKLTLSRNIIIEEKGNGFVSISVPGQSIQTVVFW